MTAQVKATRALPIRLSQLEPRSMSTTSQRLIPGQQPRVQVLLQDQVASGQRAVAQDMKDQSRLSLNTLSQDKVHGPLIKSRVQRGQTSRHQKIERQATQHRKASRPPTTASQEPAHLQGKAQSLPGPILSQVLHQPGESPVALQTTLDHTDPAGLPQ